MKPASTDHPLWMGPRCQRRFANRNQSHACGRYDLTHHFRGKDPLVRTIYDAVRDAIATCGPVTVHFRLGSLAEVDAEFRAWLHVRRPGAPPAVQRGS